MYEFKDLSTYSEINQQLPAEALNFNGVWLDNSVPKFRTLYSSGREVGQYSVFTENANLIDGATYHGRRKPEREIIVGYQIETKNPFELRQALDKLNSLLRAEKAKIIFADEPNRYFIGSLADSAGDAVGSGYRGELTFLCTDPYKYNATEKKVPLEIGDNTITNDGNAECAVRWEFEFNSDNGYIGLNSDSAAMEFGKKDEADFLDGDYNKTLVNFDTVKSSPVMNGSNHTFQVLSLNPQSPSGPLDARDWIAIDWDGIGCVSQLRTWCRSQALIPIPMDPHGDLGAKDFSCYSYHWYEASANGQTGEQVLQFLDEDNNEICAFGLTKTDLTGNTAMCYFRIGGQMAKTIEFHSDFNSPFGGGYRGHNEVRKEGGKFRFYWDNQYFTFERPELAGKVCRSIQFSLAHYVGTPYLARNYLGDLSFTKIGITGPQDIDNTFPAGTAAVIDGLEARPYLRGMYKPDLEVRGSQYFPLKAGENLIALYLSRWYSAEYAAFAVYRERWL